MMAALGYTVVLMLAISMVICYRRPSFAFVLVLILYPLKQLQMTYLPVFLQHSSWFNYIICAGVAIAAISNISRDRTALIGYWNKFIGLLLFLYLFAWFAILYSPSPEFAFDRARDGAPYWAMQMLLLPLVFSSARDIEKVFMPFLILGSVVIVLFLTNPGSSFLNGRLTLQIGYFEGVQDYRGNPLATAQMGGTLAVVAALMRPNRAAMIWNLIRLGAVFLGLGIAIAAGSRGQLILAMLTIALFWPLARRVHNVKQFFATVVGMGAIAGVSLVALRFFMGQNVEQSQRWDPSHQVETVLERARAASRLLEELANQPAKWLFGLGTNAYSAISGEKHSYAHNLFVEMLGELGILGLTCSIVLVIWGYKHCKELWLYHRDAGAERTSTAVLIAMCTYNMLLTMKQGTFVSIPDAWFVLAIACKLVYVDRAAWRAYDPALLVSDSITHYGEEDSGPAQASA
ncbi:hypothetical protein PHYC_03923 [Phycisphaerales bacterium]|nr:hypothetical protein PHYC_03923 [Phycisphaerales bacterium]